MSERYRYIRRYGRQDTPVLTSGSGECISWEWVLSESVRGLRNVTGALVIPGNALVIIGFPLVGRRELSQLGRGASDVTTGMVWSFLCVQQARNNLKHKNGHGVKKSHRKAVELFECAVELGDAPALICIRDMYKLGSGVKKDLETASELFRSGTQKQMARGGGDAGSTSEMVRLAGIYEEGFAGHDWADALQLSVPCSLKGCRDAAAASQRVVVARSREPFYSRKVERQRTFARQPLAC